MRKRYSRREFMAASARLGAALGAAPLLDACQQSDPAEVAAEAAAAQPREPLAPFAFSDGERAALSAAVARLVPAQGAGDWSAADAGAVDYIEQLLNALSGTSGNPKIHGGGPVRARFADFHALTRVKWLGWRAEILRLRELYVQGIAELNRLARGPLSLMAGDFASLSAEAQDGILESLDLQNSPFFATLFAHTMEGVYSHPVYGGNRDYIAWNSLCYQGDVHGVRYPNGFDPNADDRPWDKFGGYAPEEMILPGGTCTGGGSS